MYAIEITTIEETNIEEKILKHLNLAFGGPLLIFLLLMLVLRDDGLGFIFFGIPAGIISLVLFAIGIVSATVNVLLICNRKVVLGIFSLLIVVQFGTALYLEQKSIKNTTFGDAFKKVQSDNDDLIDDTAEKILKLQLGTSTIYDINAILVKYKQDQKEIFNNQELNSFSKTNYRSSYWERPTSYYVHELNLDVVDLILKKITEGVASDSLYMTSQDGAILFHDKVSYRTNSGTVSEEDSEVFRDDVKKGSFLLALKNSLRLIESDCNKKIGIYEFVIADLNGHKILAITLDDVMVYIASVDDHENTNDMFHGFPPKAMIKNTELHGIFATAKENEHILVCGHQEKKEDLYPLFSSFLSDSTGILIPRNFERAYRRLSATSTSSLNAWHDYVLSQRKSAELKK